MSKYNLQSARRLLNNFEFQSLFVSELRWDNPNGYDGIETPRTCMDNGKKPLKYSYQTIATLAGAKIFQVWSADTTAEPFSAADREAIAKDLTTVSAENVAIFLDKKEAPSVSIWVWRKKIDKNKTSRREHFYVKGQPGDLFIAKLKGLFFDFDQEEPKIAQVASAFEKALDVEQVTKRFFKSYQEKFDEFSLLIEGFDKEDERRWYASVLLNRLMFIYFLQKKGFVDNGDTDYLTRKLAHSKSQLGTDQFYSHFLHRLFFEGFAKPEEERSADTNALLGKIKYLNGGLFLPHKFENKELYPNVRIPDKAFDLLIGDNPKGLFNQYSWSLNDIPGQPDNEINPDVLGYIFEKYINQKQFGAYYTKPEITEYLCTQTVNRLILDKLNDSKDAGLVPALKGKTYHFDNIGELYQKMDDSIIKRLVLGDRAILKNLSLLDPACGSGAFLVSAMKVLVDLYSVIYGKVQFSLDADLKAYFKKIEQEHTSTAYYIKKLIIAHNLYGVDIMEEATEIAKLRLFLALVSSATKINDLEPLPNIDFNIMCGNSLIGLLGINTAKFEEVLQQEGNTASTTQTTTVPAHQALLFGKTTVQTELFTGQGQAAPTSATYESLIAEKERNIQLYKDTEKNNTPSALLALKAAIEDHRLKSNSILNYNLKLQMDGLKIRYEKQTWDAQKGKLGKPDKIPLDASHIDELQPFHWGYEFSHIMRNGGFDAIITNPPWEIVKPQDKEFLAKYNNLITKNKMSVLDFDKEHAKLMANDAIKDAYLKYLSSFPHQSEWFRNAHQYSNQSTVINGKRTGTDINLFKLFTEQCYNLLKSNGYCGIVIPSGIYTDLGATGLRKLLLNSTRVTGLFCFENRKTIFEGVHSRFKFVVLSFEKGGTTDSFPAAFMRHEVSELAQFPKEGSMTITRDFVSRQSPDNLSIMELKNDTELRIAEKMLLFPKLGSEQWGVKLTTEFHMTNDKHLFKTTGGEGRLPLYEGKMMHQFTHTWGQAQYWIDEAEGRAALIGAKKEDKGQLLDYQQYRLAHRAIASSTNARTFIATVIPKEVFYGHSMNSALIEDYNKLLVTVALTNSFIFDFYLRTTVSANLTMQFLYQVPIPIIDPSHRFYSSILTHTARLICTTQDYADLWEEVIGSPWDATVATHEASARQALRAELDGMIAHIYGLTEEEFSYVLSTFPLVPTTQKMAALAAFAAYNATPSPA